jgi:hypothetical protein
VRILQARCERLKGQGKMLAEGLEDAGRRLRVRS